jgi:hypothetical protein
MDFFSTECICVFRTILRLCSDHFLEQNYRLGFVMHLQYFMKNSN